MTATETITAEVNGQKFEVGAYIDGGQKTVNDFNIAVIGFADATLGGTHFGDDAADDIAIINHHADGDFADACMALEEICDGAVNALNDATEDGFYWDVAESHLVLTVDEGD